jgi:hypothetical protein
MITLPSVMVVAAGLFAAVPAVVRAVQVDPVKVLPGGIADRARLGSTIAKAEIGLGIKMKDFIEFERAFGRFQSQLEVQLGLGFHWHRRVVRAARSPRPREHNPSGTKHCGER